MSIRIKTLLISLALATTATLTLSGGCVLYPPTSPTSQDLGIIEEAWEIILRDYVNPEAIDVEALKQAAIEGMLEALDDPYSAYLDTETYQMSLSNLEGKFEGIGAYVGVNEDGQPIIIAPIPGSPAAAAGIGSGDIVLEVDGIATAGMSLGEVILHIRGPKGTPVRILVLHQGETKPEEITIVRDEIELDSVLFEMRGDIAYIIISHFSERTDIELSRVLGSALQAEANGIVLDLRSNPGGLLETVVAATSHFLEEGVVFYKVDNQGQQTSQLVKDVSITTDLPLVVLVNRYSASGSELLAGALQDHGRATIAGEKTYGKGSINTLHQLEDGSGLYITTARCYTPDAHLIEGIGITPDYVVEEENAIQWALDYLENNR